MTRMTLRCQCGDWQRSSYDLQRLAAQWSEHLRELGAAARDGHEVALTDLTWEGRGW